MVLFQKDCKKINTKEKVSLGAGERQWGFRNLRLGTKIWIMVLHSVIGSGIYLDDVDRLFWENASVLLSILGVVAVVVGVVSLLVARSVTGSIARLGQSMEGLAGGRIDIDVFGQDMSNEVGGMARMVQVFKENAIEKDQLEMAQTEAREQAEAEKRRLMAKTADDFEASIGTVVDGVSLASGTMQSSAESMTALADQTSEQTSSVAAAANRASANVQTVAAAAEELSSSIGEIGRQVAQSSEIARRAVRDAKHTNDEIRGLAEAANKIGEVVAMITDIADQTNLLALNATIEAARAGDAGKGFAVVASEVKNLANQTGNATDEIGAQIDAVQTATRDAVAAIEGIGKTIGEINDIATAIAVAVEEQASATQEIARNVEQAAADTSEVSFTVAAVTEAAGETGHTAGQVRDVAHDLADKSKTLRSEVGRILNQIRTD